jgi:hypothetical protein
MNKLLEIALEKKWAYIIERSNLYDINYDYSVKTINIYLSLLI